MAEKRLIDANALLETHRRRLVQNSVKVENGTMTKPYSNFEAAIMECLAEYLSSAPTIDAVEVVHGWWEKVQVWKDHPQTTLRCSLCKCNQPIYEHDEWKYCPFCGMPMDGGES